jgi:hypothetical protein
MQCDGISITPIRVYRSHHGNSQGIEWECPPSAQAELDEALFEKFALRLRQAQPERKGEAHLIHWNRDHNRTSPISKNGGFLNKWSVFQPVFLHPSACPHQRPSSHAESHKGHTKTHFS